MNSFLIAQLSFLAVQLVAGLLSGPTRRRGWYSTSDALLFAQKPLFAANVLCMIGVMITSYMNMSSAT